MERSSDSLKLLDTRRAKLQPHSGQHRQRVGNLPKDFFCEPESPQWKISMSSLKYAACAVALTVAIPTSFSVPAQSESSTFGSVAVQPGPVVDDKGRILIPDSSIERPEDRGKSAHTHHL